MPGHNSRSPHGVEPQSATTDAETNDALGATDMRKFRRYMGILGSGAGFFVVAFTTFLLVLIWGAVAYQLYHDRMAVLDAARTNTDNLARAYAEHVVGTLQLVDQTLVRVKNEFERGSVGPELIQHLRDFSTNEPQRVPIGVTDRRGLIIASNLGLPSQPKLLGPLSPGANFAGDRTYFLAQVGDDSGQVYISEPFISRVTGKQVLALSRRLNTSDGTFAGVTFASFDPEYLSGFFSDLAISKDSSFAVVGRDMIVRDMIRGSGRATDAIGKSVAKSELVPALALAANGNYEAVGLLDGVVRIFAYRTLPDYPLIVLASVSEADVLAGFHERKTWIIGAATALSLIFVCLAAIQLRRLAFQSRSEQTLRQTQDLLIESQRVAKLGYLVHDVPANRLTWSNSLFELRGVPRRDTYTLEEAAQYLEPSDRARYRAAREVAIAERRPFTIDVRVRKPTGTFGWEHIAVHPQFNASGRLIRVLLVIQDITERRENELELTRSRENMARAQHVAALGSFERDLVTGKNEWSDELYRIMGVEKGKFTPTYEAVLGLVHPNDREQYGAARVAGVEGIESGSLEFRIIRPDGAERVIRRENGLIFDENRKPIRIYGSYQDITEQRAAEEHARELQRKLMHSQKLEALGTLAGGIAHDLNNTLTPIMALSKIMARRHDPDSKDRSYLEMIFAASEQARDLVKRVLAFSRQEKIDKRPANLAGIVGDALKLLRATIPTSIRLDIQISEVPSIFADASQIHQIVTNLVSNAAQAIGNRLGVITVRLESIVGAGTRGEIRLSVIDTGEGMDETTRQRIFEPFYTTKQVGQGTGLGLSIVDGIVVDHGGRIAVESEPGQGTRFDLYFPLSSEDATAAA